MTMTGRVSSVLAVLTLSACGASDPALTDGRVEARDGAPAGRELSTVDSSAPPVDSGSPPASYFFGFIKAAPDDPSSKQSFALDQTQKVAAAIAKLSSPSFQSELLVDPAAISTASLKQRLESYRTRLRPGDTFVMYSHTHGVDGGLLIDFGQPPTPLAWSELARALLALPARDVIVFTMACHSGHLAAAIDAEAATWKGQRLAAGRNLVVLTAVAKDQLSSPTDTSTAPTAIGNPFTYAVRTALAGAADGHAGGSKNGKLELGELAKYVLETAQAKSKNGYAQPQLAGEHDPARVLASVPAP